MMIWLILAAVVVLLVGPRLLAERAARRSVTPELDDADGNRKLVALVHGAGGAKRCRPLVAAIRREYEDRDVVLLEYPPVYSNADPVAVAGNINREIERLTRARGYDDIVLVGSSMGALLARKAYLLGVRDAGSTWTSDVDRIVLLAGMNRGLDITGHRPSDMSRTRQLVLWFALWAGQVLRVGELGRAMEAGTPFVADLRMEWVEQFSGVGKRVEVVQLHGDIDDLVTAEDNRDLEAAGRGKFVWMLVRGTNHSQMVDLSQPELGSYREAKILRAIGYDLADLQPENEVLPAPIDRAVRHVVFVVHGIRDLGEWSSRFETALSERYYQQLNRQGKLAIVSSRYGYFGMGPFLLPFRRDKYVRWLMDEITEARARYPSAERFDFIGHSNGTYLLAKALREYESLEMDRLVFAGSVVPRDYPWRKVRNRFTMARNYTASADWVVALFPRFFELPVVRRLGNDLGSAGFNGFRKPPPTVVNVGPIAGAHSAFLHHVDSAVDYLLPLPGVGPGTPPTVGTSPWLKFVSDYLCWAVWLLIGAVLILVGLYLVGSARQLYLLVAAAYVAFLVWLLHKI